MKQFLSLIAVLLIAKPAISQTNTFPSTGAAGIGTTTPNTSSLLEINSTTKGLLISRMTKAQRDLIASPATGLLIYQTNSTPGFYYHSGTAWTAVSAKGPNKSLSNLTAPTAVNVDLLPGVDNTINLGSPANAWKNIFLKGNIFTGANRFISNAGTGNTFVGDLSGINNASNDNTAMGSYSLFSNTSGGGNTASGVYSLYSNLNGDLNTASGYYALYTNTSGSQNTAIGNRALYSNTTGELNTANGAYSLYNNLTGASNTATGFQALYSNTIGHNNTANGYRALFSNSDGSSNIALGFISSFRNTKGSFNVAIGDSSLYTDTSGSYTTAVGHRAGYDGYHNTLIRNSACTFIGAGACATGIDLPYGSVIVYNATAIGYDVRAESNQVRIGNFDVVSIGGYANWSMLSDGRFKKNIKRDVHGLDFINSLNPVSYTLDIQGLKAYYHENKEQGAKTDENLTVEEARSDDNASRIVHNGFIAQEVEKAADKLHYSFSGIDKPENKGGLYSLRYSDFVVPLVKAVQELSKMNDKKDSAITEMKSEMDKLKTTLLQLQQNFNSCDACGRSSATGQQSTGNNNLQTENLSSASLEQNIPNPFNNTTTIGYSLPPKFSSAKIIVTDKNGKQLKQLNLNNAGKGTIHVDASTLASGAYNYSLYIDGRFVTTKQMLLSK